MLVLKNGSHLYLCKFIYKHIYYVYVYTHTLLVGAAVITDGSFGSSLNYSLFENITCSENAIESSLTSCTLYSTDCLPLCPNNIAIRCFSMLFMGVSINFAQSNQSICVLLDPGNCEEGAIRLADGIIDQEGRVEVCHDGVWSSICDSGWDRTDAYIICQQLGYAETGNFTMTVHCSLVYFIRWMLLWHSFHCIPLLIFWCWKWTHFLL